MAFFMTLGSASSESVAAGAHQWPGGADVSCRDLRALDRKPQLEMREGMRDRDGERDPRRRERLRRRPPRVPPATRFPALRSCRRAARAAGGGGAGSRRRRGARRRRCRSESAAASSRALTGSSAAGPRVAQRMAPTMGRARRPASSACRSWRRDPSAPRRTRPARSRGTSGCSASRITAFAAGKGVSIAKRRAIDPLDIAVDDRDRFVEGDRRDRGRGVGADAGQRREFRRALRKARAGPRGDHARAQAMRLRARE